MKTKKLAKISFSQLWVEEEQFLANFSAQLPPGSTIVEIGTAQGGSAYIFARVTAGKNISIYSYDIAPSQEALKNLKGLKVNIIAQSSTKGAAQWPRKVGRPIDLLFLDGSHTFINIYNDYNNWVRFLKPGAWILFHDYDPLETGGIAHLAVKILGEAILKANLLSEISQTGRILTGKIISPANSQLPLSVCFKVWKEMGRQLIEFRQRNYIGWTLVGKNNNLRLILSSLLKLKKVKWKNNISGITSNDKNILLLEKPLSLAPKNYCLQRKVVLLDELTLCYLLYWGLGNQRDSLLNNTINRPEFFKWEEYLEMLEHSAQLPTPEKIFKKTFTNIHDFSRTLSRELLRLAFLRQIKKAIIYR